MKLFIFSNTLLLLSAVSLTVSSCASKSKANQKTKAPRSPVAVTVGNAQTKMIRGVNASGRLEATITAPISTRVMGNLVNLNVKVGDRVKAGQVLATINHQDMSAKRAQTEAMIAEAEANLQNARKDYQRFTALYNRQSASEKEMDNITLQYQASKARVEAAYQMRNEINAMMSYTTLIAPFSGIITQRSAEPGTMASPGIPLLIIEKENSYRVSAAIPETEISKIKLNDKAQLHIKSADKSITGKITEINPSSQYTGGQYLIKISVPETENKGLYSGMYVNVFIEAELPAVDEKEGNAILVPQSAIVEKDQLQGLYTVSHSGTALLRWVRLGKNYGDQVEVLSGLNPSESFILKAEEKLYNGVPVEVIDTL